MMMLREVADNMIHEIVWWWAIIQTYLFRFPNSLLFCSDSDLLVTEIESRVELSERPTTNGPNMELPEQTT